MKHLSADQVKEALAREDTKVVNVLPHAQFETRHIPGSVNIPIEEANFVPDVEQTIGEKDHPVIVHCSGESCDASERAAEKLEAAGFRDVARFEGGLEAWEQAGYALEGQAAGK